jgi:hypothetical protein
MSDPNEPPGSDGADGHPAATADPVQQASADQAMDIHKPKPVHSWSELAREVGVIVIGIVIALLGEQAVEALHWVHKAEAVRASLGLELTRDLAFAAEQQTREPCAERYFDALQTAIVHNDARAASALRALGPPIDTQPWQSDAWDVALAEQIPDQLGREELANYAVAFRRVSTERELQFQMFDHFNDAMTVRYGLPSNPAVEQAQLAALDKLRTEENIVLAVSGSLTREEGPALGLKPDAELTAGNAGKAAACEASLQALSSGRK